jgi:hypothetical protein
MFHVVAPAVGANCVRRDISDRLSAPEAEEENETIPGSRQRTRSSKRLDAGPFEADIRSFRLNLAAENKADKTIRVYTDAARWFAAAHLLRETLKTRWEQAEADDVRRWVARLLGECSDAYAYQQFRSLRQFFRWLAAEDGIADPMAGLRPPKVADKPVPYFSSEERRRSRRRADLGRMACPAAHHLRLPAPRRLLEHLAARDL